MQNCSLGLLMCRRNSCWQLLLRHARIVSSFRSRMVNGQKKDYFSFIEPALHRVRVALNDFQFQTGWSEKQGQSQSHQKAPAYFLYSQSATLVWRQRSIAIRTIENFDCQHYCGAVCTCLGDPLGLLRELLENRWRGLVGLYPPLIFVLNRR